MIQIAPVGVLKNVSKQMVFRTCLSLRELAVIQCRQLYSQRLVSNEE